MMFDMAVWGQYQRLTAAHRRQCIEVLRCDAVQPGQAVRTGDADDPAVRAVDDRRAAFGLALFAQWVPVVVGHPEVGSGGGHGTGDVQQRRAVVDVITRIVGRLRFSVGQVRGVGYGCGGGVGGHGRFNQLSGLHSPHIGP